MYEIERGGSSSTNWNAPEKDEESQQQPGDPGGKKRAPQLIRMDAEDLLTAIFPDQVACAENLPTGEREIPSHPLVDQTVKDCLEEAMDIDGLERLLTSIERNEKNLFARDVMPAFADA